MYTGINVKVLTLADVDDPISQKRFWDHVATSGYCWEWKGAKAADGYGLFKLGQRIHRAHRISFVTAYLYLPESMFVLHTCDNPGCVNPTHLYAGSIADNNRDTRDRGRFGCGPHIKLTDRDVVEIRERYARGETSPRLAVEFNLYPSYVLKIVTGQRKQYLGGPITKKSGGRPKKA